MALVAHINTRDLLALHDDLMLDKFCGVNWQYGEDGEISGTTVPCTFKSSTINLNHYISDDDADTIDNEANRVRLIADNVEQPLPVLNVHSKGFFRITSITNNQECTIDYIAPSISRIINRGLGLDLDETDITEGTGLTWSLGGYEEKIAIAYCDLITDLINRGLVTAVELDADDPTYIPALRYKALQLIYTSLMTSPEDNAANLAGVYYKQYQKELTTAKPYTTTQRATRTFERC